ncbi:hypothetical protein EXU85_03610 [Spirosoma sp. KCTC 42546]|uniref:hypothetical protein n=1 Tax=Spirosoma sp. KCTC 42546 TaxID=2520506 RepID=UPI00115897F3|nr:hypothetical protein [Spirosoma sp. KCTC 42546]QDK77729.1 hypothetical protein EXU85_03610 [Spirosoma sp. KCTC 42546]
MRQFLFVHQLRTSRIIVLFYLLSNGYSAFGQQTSNSGALGNVRELGTSDALEQMIAEEAARLDRTTGFSTPVRITDGPIEANPQYGILINKRRLQSFLSQSEMHSMRDLVQAVLAHEKAHWIQYRDNRYGFQILNWGFEQKRIIECQADILAGKYFTETFGTAKAKRLENPLPLTATDRTPANVKDILQLAFDLGSYESTSNRGSDVHPSRQARRIAFRFGMSVGGLDFAKREIARLSRSSEPGSSQLIQDYRNMIDVVSYKTSFNPQQTDVLDWSFWQASRITHYNTAASKDISFVINNEQWSRNPNNPTVTYSVTVQNNGERSIRSDFAIQCDWFPKEDIRNTKESLLISIKSYRFTLKPGEKRTLEASLPTSQIGIPNAEDYVMILTVPPMPTSLMRFEYVDEQPNDQSPTSTHAFGVKSTRPIRDDLLRILPAYAKAVRNNYKDLIAGPSLRYGYEVDTDKVIQYGFTPYENIVETKIISSASDRYPPMLAVTLFQTLDSDEQDDVFSDIAEKLTTIDGINRYQLNDGTDPNKVLVFTYNLTPNHFLALAKIKAPNSRYEVQLIFKKMSS